MVISVQNNRTVSNRGPLQNTGIRQKKIYNEAIGKYKKYTQSNHSAKFLSECVKHNLTPNIFKIKNPLQTVSVTHTKEVDRS